MATTPKKTRHIDEYFFETAQICKKIDLDKINKLVEELLELRVRGGRLFLLGVGGSAANCSHFCNDLRKLANIEAYCVSDNVSELTARSNDEGFDTIFCEWLKVSKLNENDAIFVFSVGGGAKGVSECLIKAIDYAKFCKSRIFGVCGRREGYLNKKGDVVIIVPNVNPKHITAHSEAFQLVISHCLTSHIYLQFHSTKW